jgi:hypothetical protein
MVFMQKQLKQLELLSRFVSLVDKSDNLVCKIQINEREKR